MCVCYIYIAVFNESNKFFISVFYINVTLSLIFLCVCEWLIIIKSCTDLSKKNLPCPYFLIIHFKMFLSVTMESMFHFLRMSK